MLTNAILIRTIMKPKNLEEIYSKRDLLMSEMHSDIKHLVKNFDQHVIDDKETAKVIKRDLAWQNKILYMGLGVVAFVSFITQFMK